MMYPGVKHDLAMAFGDEFDPKHVSAGALAGFAEDAKLDMKLLTARLQKLSEKIIHTLNTSTIVDKDLLTDDEQLFSKNLKDLIIQRAAGFLENSKK